MPHNFSLRKQVGSGVPHRLKLTELIIRQSGERCIAVVKPRHDEQHDKRPQKWPRQRSENAPYLAENSEAVGHGNGNVHAHGRVSVQVDLDHGPRMLAE